MRAILCCLSLTPALAWAADAPPGVSMGNVFWVFLSLILILVCLFLCAFLAQKFMGNARLGSKGLRLLGGIALGPRERIVLVEAGEQWLVVGVVPGQIRTLHRMPRGAFEPEAEGKAPAASSLLPAHTFADWMRRFSRRDPS